VIPDNNNNNNNNNKIPPDSGWAVASFFFFLPEFDNAAGHLTFPQINEHHVATANVRVLADTLFLDVVEVTSFVFPNAPPQPEEHGGRWCHWWVPNMPNPERRNNTTIRHAPTS
jgi:hypothetical protein